MSPVRIFLLDEQALFRQSFAKLIQVSDTLQLVGEAPTIAQAIEMLNHEPADLLVISATLTHKNAYYGVRQLKSRFTRMHIAVLDTYPVEIHLQQAMKAGAIGYFTRCDEFRRVEAWLLAVSRGEQSVPPDFSASIFDTTELTSAPKILTDSQLSLLTARELEILRHLAEGLSVRQSPEKLSQAQSTVDNHKSRLMRKLNVHKSADLTRLAIREGLLRA